MKRQILISLLLLTSLGALNAQVYSPNGTIQGTSGNNNIGIGTDNPISPLHVLGNAFPQTRINNENSGGESGVRIRSVSSTNSLHVDLVTKYTGPGDEQGKFYIRVPWNSPERLTIDHMGNIGIGLAEPENYDSWDRVLNVYGQNHSKITTSSSNVNTGLWSHNLGYYGAPAGGMAGTYSNHPFSIITNHIARMTISASGNVAIYGKLEAKEIKVSLSPTADFVFDKNYKLMDLSVVENYIKENKHLPEIPSAKEIEKDGVNLAEMNAKLLQKIEELTLYTIEQNKELQLLKEKIAKLESASK